MDTPERIRFAPTEESEAKQLVEDFEAARADPESATAEDFRGARARGATSRSRLSFRKWVSRWRWPLLAMTMAILTAVTCVVIGMLSPDDNIDAYYFISGFGGGVFGSTVVASVVFLVELKRNEIRTIEQLQSNQFQLSVLERAMAERFTTADGRSNAEAILDEIKVSTDSFVETLDELRAQIERIEQSLS